MAHTALIIEDDVPTREMLTHLLKSLNYTIHIAQNGEEAIEKLEQITPNLILLDLLMPLVPGERVLEYLYMNERFNATRVLILTAHPDSIRHVKLRSGDAVLIKPTSLKKLRSLLT